MATRPLFLGATLAAAAAFALPAMPAVPAVAPFLMALAATPAVSAPRNETARIEALIAAVGRLQGATFIRNGSGHTAAEAASHLRLKWRNAGRRVRTAEDFIRYCASRSSMTGRAYRIRFADGREVDSADYFHAELRRYDAAQQALRPAPASTPG